MGETVGRSEAVAGLVSTEDRLYVETGVVEGQIDQVQAGQRASVIIEAFGGQALSGVVTGLSREVTMPGRTGTVLIGLPDHVQSKVRPGLSARCSIVVFSKTRVVKIPLKAADAGRAVISSPAQKIIDQAIKQGLRDLESGRVVGPFRTVKEFKKALSK